MLLIGYERKFDQLSRYAPHLVDIEVKKVKRFEHGLGLEFIMIIMSHCFIVLSNIGDDS